MIGAKLKCAANWEAPSLSNVSQYVLLEPHDHGSGLLGMMRVSAPDNKDGYDDKAVAKLVAGPANHALQAHSVRGFISGALGKKLGLAVESTKGEDGERTYSLKG